MEDRSEDYKTVNLEFLSNFILEHFGISVSSSTISRCMHELSFTSKMAQESIIQANEADAKEMRKWLEDTRLFIKESKLTHSRIVTMDQISLWDHGIIQRSYALIGG